MEAVIDEPADHEYFKEGSYYKEGRFDFIYMWNNGHWQRSGKILADLVRKEPKVTSNGSKARKKGPFKKEIVLEVIQKQGGMTRYELLERTGMTSIAVENALKGLQEAGKVQFRNNVYAIPCSLNIKLFQGLSL